MLLEPTHQNEMNCWVRFRNCGALVFGGRKMKTPIELVNGHTMAFPVLISGYFIKADTRGIHSNG